MTKALRLTLVIDASIARAAADSDHPRSRSCRNFLRDVLKICHRVALTKDIGVEWERHQSRFASKWLGTMERRGKRIDLGRVRCEKLRNRIQSLQAKLTDRQAMAKDAPLVVAAQQASLVIVSLDDEAKRLFELHAARLKTPKNIEWWNSEKELPNDQLD